jgi:cytochrome c6
MTSKVPFFYLFSMFVCFFSSQNFSYAVDLGTGGKIFVNNCSVCHNGGNNIIIPEKNLKKDTLEANGMNTKSAISYQVLNGKNGMPAFGGRLTETEIEEVAEYVLEQSRINFKNN